MTNSCRIELSPAVFLDVGEQLKDHCYKDSSHDIASLYHELLKFQSQPFQTRRLEIKRLLDFAYSSTLLTFSFKLDHLSVCDSCVRKRLGLSDRSWRRYIKQFKDGELLDEKVEVISRALSARGALARAWFRQEVSEIGESYPNIDRIDLPPMTRVAFYLMYKQAHPIDFIKQSTFFSIWKKEFQHVKPPRQVRLGKCQVCVETLEDLQKSRKNPKRLAEIREKRRNHFSDVKKDRNAYHDTVALARAYPEKYLSIVIDTMDQKKTHLPRFFNLVKDQAYSHLRVRCVGVIVHGKVNVKRGFFLTSQWSCDSNVTIECLVRTLESIGWHNLPNTIFIQMDNTSKENKNERYAFASF